MQGVWAAAPTLTAYQPTNITATSAYLKASVTSTGDALPGLVAYWGTTSGGTNTAGAGWAFTNRLNQGQAVGTTSYQATALSGTTWYHNVWAATNSGGTGWSAVITFRTITPVVAPTTTAVQAVTVDTNDNLKHPTNLFGQNKQLIIDAGFVTGTPVYVESDPVAVPMVNGLGEAFTNRAGLIETNLWNAGLAHTNLAGDVSVVSNIAVTGSNLAAEAKALAVQVSNLTAEVQAWAQAGSNLAFLVSTSKVDFTGGVLTGPLLTTVTVAPADNELARAGWVRGLFDIGLPQYLSNGVAAVAFLPTNTTYYGMGTVPADIGTINAAVTGVNHYCISMISTQTFTGTLRGPVSIHAHLFIESGSPSANYTLSVSPEIYYVYDVNEQPVLGDWNADARAITPGSTNEYDWTLSFPETEVTNAYTVARLKVTAKGSAITNLVMAYGGALASHVGYPTPSATVSANDYGLGLVVTNNYDLFSTQKVDYADATYTATVGKAASALQVEVDPSWSGGTDAIWQAISGITDTGATNFVAAGSNVNFQTYDPATRTVTYCVTNGGGGGTGDASLWYTYPARSNVTWVLEEVAGTYHASSTSELGSVGSNIAWQDPTNISLTDLQYAHIPSTNESSDYDMALNFGFNVPATASITGLTVRVIGYGTGTTFRFMVRAPADLYAYNSGVEFPLFGDITTNDYQIPVGAGNDITSLTPAQVNDPSFGVGPYLPAAPGTVGGWFDSIQVAVQYDIDSWEVGPSTDNVWQVVGEGVPLLSVSTGGVVTATAFVGDGSGLTGISGGVTATVLQAASGTGDFTLASGVLTLTPPAAGAASWGGGAITNPSSFSGGLTVTNGPSGMTTNATFEVNASTPYTAGMRIRTKLGPSTNDWTPAALTNYSVVGWFDAEWSKNYLTNNASVATWSNRVSALSLAGLTVNPTMRYGVLNGKAALEFSGGSTLYNHSLNVKYPHSSYAVIQVRSNQTRQGVFDQSFSATGFRFELLNYTNGVWNISGGTNLSVTNTSSANVYSTNIIAVKLNASASSIRVGRFVNSGSAGTTDVNGWRIGRDNFGTYKFGGYVAEMLIVSNVVDDATDDIIRGYLAKKYSLQSELPDDSMYKFDGPTLDPLIPVTNAFEVLNHAGARVAQIDQDGNITGNGVNLTTLKGQFDGSSNAWANMPAIWVSSTNPWTVANAGDLIVPFQKVEESRGGTYDGSNWTPGVVGWVTMSAAVRVNGTLTGRSRLGVHKNGAGVLYGPETYVSGVSTPGVCFSGSFYNNATTNSYYIRFDNDLGQVVTNSAAGSVSWWSAIMSK